MKLLGLLLACLSVPLKAARPQAIYVLEFDTNITGENRSVSQDLSNAIETAFSRRRSAFRLLERRNDLAAKTSEHRGRGSTSQVQVNAPLEGKLPPPPLSTNANSSNPGRAVPASPPAKLYETKVRVYQGLEPPKFSVNDGAKRADVFEGGLATFHLPAGACDIKAEYPERICEAFFSVPRDGEAQANCHLR